MGAGSTRSLVEEPGAGEGPFTALGFAAASLAVSPAVWSGRGVRRVSARVVRRDEGRGSPSVISLAASIDPGWIVGLHLGGGFIFVFSDDGSAVAGHRRRPSRGLALRVHRHLRVPIARAAAADVVGEGRLAGRVALAGDPLEVLLAEPPSRGPRSPRLVGEPEQAEPHAAVRLEQRLRRARAVVAGTRPAAVAK